MVWQSPNTGSYYNEHGLCDKDGRQITIDLGKVIGRALQFTKGERSLRLSLSSISEMDELVRRAMSTTNDPQAPYGEKPEQREMELSDDQQDSLLGLVLHGTKFSWSNETLAKNCERCGYCCAMMDDDVIAGWHFCPGCGAKIVER